MKAAYDGVTCLWLLCAELTASVAEQQQQCGCQQAAVVLQPLFNVLAVGGVAAWQANGICHDFCPGHGRLNC